MPIVRFALVLLLSLLATACARLPAAPDTPVARAASATVPATTMAERLHTILQGAVRPADLDASVIGRTFDVRLVSGTDAPGDRVAAVQVGDWWAHLLLGTIHADARPLFIWSVHADRALTSPPDACVLPLDRLRTSLESSGYAGVDMDDGHHFAPHWAYTRDRTRVELRTYAPASVPDQICVSTVSVQIARGEG